MAGLDHFGFKVENLEAAKKDLDNLATTAPASAARKIAIGPATAKNVRRISKHANSAATPWPIRMGSDLI